MELQLTAQTTIKEIKRQFSSFFPFLKIEFFHYPHKDRQGSLPLNKVHEKLRLIDITGVIKEGVFSFTSSSTVAAFEQAMQQQYGLPVQVFRKSGNLWLETTQTDHLTLETQNSMGRDSVKPRTAFKMDTDPL